MARMTVGRDKKKMLLIMAGILGGGAIWYYFAKRRTQSSAPISSVVNAPNPIATIIQDTALTVKSMTAQGIVNNNPLNIKWDANSRKDPWVGQTGERGKFVVFSSPVYGFRAAARIFRTYQKNYGLNTIAGIVSRWAPASDNNDVKGYTKFVSQKTGILEFTPITINDYPKILVAMAKMETGKDYSLADAQKGVSLIDATK